MNEFYEAVSNLFEELRCDSGEREYTDHTISSIALDNGFASSRAFSREFVKRYGILPGRAERQNHKNVKKVL